MGLTSSWAVELLSAAAGIPYSRMLSTWSFIKEIKGEITTVAPGIIKENENDVLATFDPQNIVDHWDEIRAIIAEIPSAEELAALCEKLGAFYKPEQIGIDPALSEDMLSVSAAIRNRLTLIRMRRVLDFGE